MKKPEHNEHDIKEFAEWLQDQLWKFDITQAELAKAIGVDQKTINNYVNKNIAHLPDEGRINAILHFFDEKAEQLGDFKRIPEEEFAALLNRLLGEFDLSQRELAKAIGKRQEDISNYICRKAVPDIWTQHKILRYFYRQSMSSTEYSSLHFGTAVHLEYLLYGEESGAAYFIDDCNIEMGDTASFRHCIQYILTLPVPLQEFITRHLQAFYDNTMETIVNYGCTFDFKLLSYAIELFRQLNEEQRRAIVGELEKDAFMGFPANDAEFFFFDQITTYRCVIYANIERLKQSECYSRNKKDMTTFVTSFEHDVNQFGIGDQDFIEEVKFKLTLTRYEWYVWMLLLINIFKGHELWRITDRMMDLIHCFDHSKYI